MAKAYDTTSLQAVPIGSVIPLPATGLPPGFLFCDGSQVSRTVYAKLFAAIGVAHGYGNNSTTFHIPGYKGTFLRGVSTSTTEDPDRASRTAMATGGNTGAAVGSVQGFALQNITGQVGEHNALGAGNFASGAFTRSGNGTGQGYSPSGTDPYVIYTFNASLVVNTSTETRPKNAYTNFIIRFE